MSVTDSAGVRLVSHESDWANTTVPIEEQWVYGHGSGQYMFHYVFVGAVMDDGSAVVGDTGNQEIVAIDPAAAGHEVLARTGQGPGEVMYPRAVVGAGDRIFWVEDVGNGKLMRYHDRSLDFSVSTVAIPAISRGLMPQGVDAGGRLLMTTSRHRSDFDEPWLWGSMITFDPEAGTIDTVGSYPMARHRDEGPLNPFSPFGVVASAGGQFVNARNDQPIVTWRTSEGEVAQIANWEPVMAYPTDSLWARFEASLRADLRRVNPHLGGEELREFVDQQVALYRMDPSVPLPLFGPIHGSSTGDVWLGEFSPGNTWPSAYRLMSSTGQWLGRVTFPGPTRILDIRDDLVLCVLTDELDVQGIALYRYRLES